MAYFGKTFTVTKEENYDNFIKCLGLPAEDTERFIAYKPKTKIEKDGETYKITSENASGNKVVEFKSGVEFEEAFKPDLKVNTKYTVDGDTITQEIHKDGRSATFKREYSADQLKVTITTNFWDGVAVRYYNPV